MPFYSPFNKENLIQIPQTKAGKIQPLQRKSKNKKTGITKIKSQNKEKEQQTKTFSPNC